MKDLKTTLKIDSRGRVTIPKDVRLMYDVTDGADEYDCFYENDYLILKLKRTVQNK